MIKAQIWLALGALVLLSACATTSDLTREPLPTQSIDAPPPPPPAETDKTPLPTQPIDAPPPPPPVSGS
ncbi:MAG: hypothetical protein ACTHLA_15240 [Asticcacaulis sp.]|uniref:hypothetical protein n=1 Tax=Asticcacaulis sp. TaxID=1872648 RepID=UPI003F7CB93C